MVVKVNNLVKRYKELIALDHFNMDVKEGEIEVFGEKMTPNAYNATARTYIAVANWF